jgi:Ca2+-binding EF-hand superfamily protein
MSYSKVTDTELKNCFDIFDVGNHGFIHKNDTAMGVRALGLNPTEEQLKRAFKDMDENVNFSAFSRIYKSNSFSRPEDQEMDCNENFKVLDSDNDGTISESDLRQMLITVGDTMTHLEVDLLMEEITVDQQGRIKYEDFVKLICHGYDELMG